MGKSEKAKERREQRLQEISLLRTIPYSDHQRWWSTETVAVVTGSNRGIGFEIARQLAVHGLTVVLTSRDDAVGEEAVKVLQEGSLNVIFHQLDVLDPSSIQRFTDWVKLKFGGIDILVNNAGVNFNFGSENSVEHAEMVISTNYYGTKNMIKAMIPLMRPSEAGARIVNVSSRLGRIHGRRNKIEDETLRQHLEDIETLTEEAIDEMVSSFIKQVEDGSWASSERWPQTFTDYSVSKLAVNAYTRVVAKKMMMMVEEEEEEEEEDSNNKKKIFVNCYCPGWVKTAMTGWAGNISAEDGADTGVWLALLPHQSVTGKFFAERREINF